MKKYFTLDNALDWRDVLNTFNPTVYTLLDSNDGDFIFSWNQESELVQDNFDTSKLKSFESCNKGKYIFGYIGYDAKNAFFKTTKIKKNENTILPESIFFIPEHTLIKKNGHYLYYGRKENIKQITKVKNSDKKIENDYKLLSNISCTTKKSDYLTNVTSIKELIQNGDIYELNYCIKFYKQNTQVDIINSFFNLKKNTEAPFSGLFRHNDYYILSASPERFFNKSKDSIISQPIKGTAPRGKNYNEDQINKSNLKNDLKELAENIMIVDLVRNDFSRFSNKKSVRVTELCELYSFKNVHQLISTISSKVNQNITFEEILNYIFPMGSMTGAPKKNAIDFINKFENFNRNCYSGSLGLITPKNNMDFNVVIRSVTYNSRRKELNIGVGGAITHKSIPNREYEECLLKLNSIKNSIIIS